MVLDAVPKENLGGGVRVVLLRGRERGELLEDLARRDVSDRLTAEGVVLKESAVVGDGTRAVPRLAECEELGFGVVEGGVRGCDLTESLVREALLGLGSCRCQ
jgi:hypothetical protein